MLSPVSKKMKIIHSINNLGGFLTTPDNRLVGLVGMTAKSFPILISSDTIGANLDIEVPLVLDIKATQNEVDFSGLEFKTKEKYSGAPFALLSPFLAKVVMETKTHCQIFYSKNLWPSFLPSTFNLPWEMNVIGKKVDTSFSFFGQLANVY